MGKRNPVSFAKQLIDSNVDLIQLRDKKHNTADFIKIARQIKKIASLKKIPLIINDRISAAKLVRAFGVHLGQNDLPIKYARKRLEKKQTIGVSCHSLSEINKALKSKVNYIAIGPIFCTKTKPDLKPMDIKILKNIIKRVTIPIFAIGGINEKNIAILKRLNITGVALINYFITKENLKKAVKKLRTA